MPCSNPSGSALGGPVPYVCVGAHTLRVLSLLPLTKSRLSEDHATWYTGPTWARMVATKVPFSPSHSLMALSNDALTNHLPSGENWTCV